MIEPCVNDRNIFLIVACDRQFFELYLRLKDFPISSDFELMRVFPVLDESVEERSEQIDGLIVDGQDLIAGF